MADKVQEQLLRDMAALLDEVFSVAYGQRMGFTLVVTPFGENKIADYISNVERACVVEMLREMACTLEANQDIPASEGEA